MTTLKKVLALLALGGAAVSASAVEFVPPNDQVGSVWSTNTNDGYSGGRGIVFEVASNTELTSVGIFHDLRNIALSFVLEEFGGAVLRSGGSLVTTLGLEWIDYAVSPVTLVAGVQYHLEFSHQGAGTQNFFYNNSNVSWDQDGFENLEGTQNGGLSNSVVAAFRVNAEVAQGVPDSGSTLALLGLSFVGFIVARRRATR